MTPLPTNTITNYQQNLTIINEMTSTLYWVQYNSNRNCASTAALEFKISPSKQVTFIGWELVTICGITTSHICGLASDIHNLNFFVGPLVVLQQSVAGRSCNSSINYLVETFFSANWFQPIARCSVRLTTLCKWNNLLSELCVFVFLVQSQCNLRFKVIVTKKPMCVIYLRDTTFCICVSLVRDEKCSPHGGRVATEQRHKVPPNLSKPPFDPSSPHSITHLCQPVCA